MSKRTRERVSLTLTIRELAIRSKLFKFLNLLDVGVFRAHGQGNASWHSGHFVFYCSAEYQSVKRIS